MKFVALWNKFKCYLHVYRFTGVYEMRKEIRGLCPRIIYPANVRIVWIAIITLIWL